MKKITFLLFLCIGQVFVLSAQKKEVSLADIWVKRLFYPKTVDGFNFTKDGKHYTQQEDQETSSVISEFDLRTGKKTQDIFNGARIIGANFSSSGFIDDYQLSADERKLLIKTEGEPVYRHSRRSIYYVWDRDKNELTQLVGKDKVRCASFSPDGQKIAFVLDNNLFIKDLNSSEMTPVTNDGEWNKIINGATDWVYEEEFSFDIAFAWSPDGTKLGYLRFDERAVPEYDMPLYQKNVAYPVSFSFKYPKVGENNAIVSAHIYNLKTGKNVSVDVGTDKSQYIPRIKWTEDNRLCVFRMNRHQNRLDLLLAESDTGFTTTLFAETNNAYIDIHDNLTFLKDKKHFLWTSEKDGFNQLYLFDMNGEVVRQITTDNIDITNFYGIDEAAKTLYYQAADTPEERYIYSIDIKGKNKKKLSSKKGTNDAEFSKTFEYMVLKHSSDKDLPSFSVFTTAKLENVRTIENNEELKERLSYYDWALKEFFTFETTEKVKLNAWMMKPIDFDPAKKYPVLFHIYGGPGAQMVLNSWDMQYWHQVLLSKGYIIVSVDNRGTSCKGEQFKKSTYMQLGNLETKDQIEAAKYMANLPYVDPARIGIFGWSFGGYLSSLCLFKGSEVFKMAIAVAPVTNWKWYDSIYTERYLRTHNENPKGYEENSPINFAHLLKGDYLIVHGTADDNVHFQNTVEMINKLIAEGKQFDSYIYPNRNHSIGDGAARLHLFTKIINFVTEKL